MGKSKIIIIVLLFLLSCKEEKIEFVQSRAIPALILIKNPPKSDSLLKTQIIDFLQANNSGKKYFSFYHYTSNTYYFLENKEETTGGFSQNALYDYPEDDIAVFEISECKKDSTKLVGELYFYGNAGLEGSKREIDTLIYHCK